VSNPKITRNRAFLGDVMLSCTACGESLHGGEVFCPHCRVELRTAVDRQLEALEPVFDRVLHKHHPEAAFDFPGGFCEGEDVDEP